MKRNYEISDMEQFAFLTCRLAKKVGIPINFDLIKESVHRCGFVEFISIKDSRAESVLFDYVYDNGAENVAQDIVYRFGAASLKSEISEAMKSELNSYNSNGSEGGKINQVMLKSALKWSRLSLNCFRR